MEPGLRGREDAVHTTPSRCSVSRPLWSPAFGAGKTRRRRRRWRPGPARPLWSPAFGAGKTRPVAPRRRPGRSRRYGARPSGPGRPGNQRPRVMVTRRRYGARPSGPGRPEPQQPHLEAGFMPLWSPAFGAGKTGVQVPGTSRTAGSRYGARPSGPGRRGAALLADRLDPAAMEPGLRGREDTGGPPAPTPPTTGPLWSPAFGAGKTRPASPPCPSPACAAMEPGLRGREDPPRHPS